MVFAQLNEGAKLLEVILLLCLYPVFKDLVLARRDIGDARVYHNFLHLTIDVAQWICRLILLENFLVYVVVDELAIYSLLNDSLRLAINRCSVSEHSSLGCITRRHHSTGKPKILVLHERILVKHEA